MVFKMAESDIAPGGNFTAASLVGFFSPVSDLFSPREQETEISGPRVIMSRQELVKRKGHLSREEGVAASRDLVKFLAPFMPVSNVKAKCEEGGYNFPGSLE